MALFSRLVGQKWTIIGTIFNSLVMIEVTNMTEKRIMDFNSIRAEAYRKYIACTSMWVPFFPFSFSTSVSDNIVAVVAEKED